MPLRSNLSRAAALAGVMVVLPAAAQQPAAPTTTPSAPPAAVLAPAAEAKVMVVGSVVQLRSGGPKLTIVELSASTATVQWHQDNTGFKKETFPVAALKLVEDADDSDDEDEDDEDDEE